MIDCDEYDCIHRGNDLKCNVKGQTCMIKFDFLYKGLMGLKQYLENTIRAENATEPNAQEVLRQLDKILINSGIIDEPKKEEGKED